ncbi:MAG: BACON domain-containing protein [Bacteroidales bacterium]|nr:BACON domain-containing protein [Bacteroidales bacterium]
MKTIVKILSVGLLAAACQQFYVDTQMTPDQAVAKLECDALETYTIQGDKPQAVSFKVASTTPWTITGYEKAEWLKVSPVSSAFSSLSEDIVINAVANPNYQDRSATLTLSSEGTDTTYKIVINQTRKGKLFVQGVIDVFEAEGNTLPFTIETNLAWEVRSDEQWLSFDKNSGVGDGTVQTINATAAANASVSRKATVTVSAGEDKVSFEVNQKGQSLEFLPVEEPVIDRMGGTLELGVKTTMNWVVECDNSDFTVVKEADKVVVSAPFNNKFKARTAVITIKPASGDFGDVSSTVEVSQDCNFELSGGCEVLEDGSVKFSASSDKPRVTTKDRIRYASIVLTMGDVHFGDKGHLCLSTHDAGLTGNSELQCQVNLDGNKRLRTNGGNTSYNTAKFSISKDELNALKTYQVDFVPDTETPGNIHLEFFYNGTSMASLSSPSPFVDDPESGGHYFFGFESSKDDDSWYIVKSCDITLKGE